jgi:predicted nucleotidyltransferase
MIKSLFPKTKRKILSLMLLHPDDRFYLRDISRKINVSQGTLHRDLKPLVWDGILLSESRVNQSYYSVNKNCPIYNELRGIIIKTFGVVNILEKSIELYRDKINFAFIYGSLAKGDDTGNSDIDLFVVGDIDYSGLSDSILSRENELGRPVNMFLLTPHDLKMKIEEENHFVTNVLKSEKIFLRGSEDDIKRLAE